MLEGLSTSRRCESSAACLIAEGRTFVFRYHSRTTKIAEKRLSPREAAELARAGISIATVYQDRARKLEDFGAARGERDAISALILAGQVGQGAGSAVYFAVDEDFSKADIQSAVLPYFASIDRIFKAAAGGSAYLKIGVYGSGLTCRLVGELPFVDFAWLAEATGWRESAVFDAWTVKQHRNTGQSLCGLGNQFERCEAHEGFGEFKPVGFAVTAGLGERRQVTEGGGNLRHLPSTQFNEPITLLPPGHVVRVLGTSRPGWARVRTQQGGGEVIGHMAESRLQAPAALPVPLPPVSLAATTLPVAQLPEDNANAKRQSAGSRAHPIGENSRKVRDPAAAAIDRIAQSIALADWLSVETSARYARTPDKTFCNVYAADYGYLARAYLPRVWWTDSALLRIGQGEALSASLNDTVREMRADDLFAWLVDVGPAFGWTRVFDATALQNAANAGGVGVICADRAAPGMPGHITLVVPEDATHRAMRDADGHVTQPLQTQAGAVNRRFGSAGPNWWMGSEFLDRGFFVHA